MLLSSGPKRSTGEGKGTADEGISKEERALQTNLVFQEETRADGAERRKKKEEGSGHLGSHLHCKGGTQLSFGL